MPTETLPIRPTQRGAEPAPRAGAAASGGYVVVHLVAFEARKALIAAQVVDHMAVQAAAGGADGPDEIAIGFLETGRAALSGAVRGRLREYRTRAPRVRVLSLPVASRLGLRANARVHAWRLRRFARGRPIVLHCRGENAIEWAVHLAPHLGHVGIIGDIRGAWPEELLFERGYDGPLHAEAGALTEYRAAQQRLRGLLAHAGAVLTVSDAMVDWLAEQGVPADRLARVPCCVTEVATDAATRHRMRAQLGLEGRHVLAYSGTLTGYQHVEDGVLPFFREACGVMDTAHLLFLTSEPDRARTMADAAGIEPGRVTIRAVPQREVADHLAAADAGFLLRAPTRMNRVSMPVKLGEYLAAGVPLIISRIEGWVHGLVEGHHAGIAVDWFGVDADTRRREVVRVCTALRTRGDELRVGARRLCEDEFLWSRYVTDVRAAYRRALATTASPRA